MHFGAHNLSLLKKVIIISYHTSSRAKTLKEFLLFSSSGIALL